MTVAKSRSLQGKVSKPTLEEQAELPAHELAQGYRLACQTFPESDVKVHVPPESLTALQRTQVEGLDVDVEPDPPVRGLEAYLTQPTLESPKSDIQNLWHALVPYGISRGQIDFRIQQNSLAENP